MFERTVLPRDFDAVEIPFPERGAPELVRWDPDAHVAEDVGTPPEPARRSRHGTARAPARSRPNGCCSSRSGPSMRSS